MCSLLAFCAACMLFAPSPSPHVAPPAFRIVVGDPLPLLTWFLDRPAVRDEMSSGGVSLLSVAHGPKAQSFVANLLAKPEVFAPWLPTRIVLEAPTEVWHMLDGLLSAEASVPPGTTWALGARIEFRSPQSARVVAAGAATALGLVADGADRWRWPDDTAGDHATPSAAGPPALVHDGTTLTLSVGGVAPPVAGDETALVDLRWDSSPLATMNDSSARALLIESVGSPGPGRFVLTLGDGIEWHTELPVPPDPPNLRLLDWAPAGAAIWYDGFARFPQSLMHDAEQKAVAEAFFAGVDPPLSPGFLLVVGVDRTTHISMRFLSGSVVSSSDQRAPGLALVLPAPEPTRTLESLRRRLKETTGIELVPHSMSHGGPTWALPEDWGRSKGMTYGDLGSGFEAHIFAGPDALVISYDDTLSQRLRAAHRGAERRPRSANEVVLIDDGGTYGLMRGVVAFTMMIRVLHITHEDRRKALGMIAVSRLVQAVGMLHRSARIVGGQVRGEGRLVPSIKPLPPMGLPEGDDGRTAAWLERWCAAGSSPYREADGFRLVRARDGDALSVGQLRTGLGATLAGHGEPGALIPWQATSPSDTSGRSADLDKLKATISSRRDPASTLVFALGGDLPAWRALDALSAAHRAGVERITLVVADDDAKARGLPPAFDPAAFEALRPHFAADASPENQAASMAAIDAVEAHCPGAHGPFALLAGEGDVCPAFTTAMTQALAACEVRAHTEMLTLLAAMRGQDEPGVFGLDRRLEVAPALWARAGTWGEVAPKLLVGESIPIGVR